MVPESKAEELARDTLGGEWKAESFGAGRFSQTFLLKPPVKGSGRSGPRGKSDPGGAGGAAGPGGSGPAGAAAEDSEYILRIAPPDNMTQLFYEYRMMRQEPEIHSIVRERTSVPIPEIRAHDFSRSKIDRDYLIMPRIPGKPLSEAGLSLEAAERAHRRWGEYTEQLHNLTAGANEFGYSGAHRPMEPKSSWADAFFEMYRLELEDIRRLGVYDKGKFDYALDLLRERLAVFDNVAAPVMCHGDLWVTNLLVRPGGEVTALIDFDRACWGDPEWDLAIADYCGVTTGAFLSGYGGDPRTAAGVSREAAELRRTFYILYEHQKYIVISLSARRNDPAGARRYAEQSLRMMRQL